jgi:UPF0176 protein
MAAPETPTPALSSYCILAFYKFVETHIEPSKELPDVRAELESVFIRHFARGAVLLASEGINGTVCYPLDNKNTNNNNKNDTDAVLEYLTTTFVGIRTRVSWSPSPVFTRLRIRIKTEIVTMGKVLLPTAEGDNDSDNGSSSDINDDSYRACEASTSTCLRQSPGEYVPADQWNALVQDPSVLVIDTRNEYEIAVGTFQNAVNPHTESFLEFPAWLDAYLSEKQQQQQQQQHAGDGIHPPITGIAMFCTGGIRCEKATSYCRQVLAEKKSVSTASSVSTSTSTVSSQQEQQSDINANPDTKSNSSATASTTTSNNTILPVYHLEGGILAYLDTVPQEESLFEGDCFVFDQRIAVQTGLHPAPNYASCHACRAVLRPVDLASPQYEDGISCPACWDSRSERQERYRERQLQMTLSTLKGIPHLHDGKARTRTSAVHMHDPAKLEDDTSEK